MYKKLNKAIGLEENKAQLNAIKNKLAKSLKEFKSSPTSDAKKIENRYNMLKIFERVLEFKQLNQSGQGLKILTPNEMLSRLQISLAQLNAGNNPEKLKNEIRQLLYSCTDQKNLQKISIRVWLHYLNMETIFMNIENSKTNQSDKFIYQFTDKLNLKTPNNKILDWLI